MKPCCIFLYSLLAFQKGMKLPGSRPDVLRTKSLSGPSPVGGAFGGTESQRVMTLDDFELQAAHYNMACAHSQLGNLDEVGFYCGSQKQPMSTWMKAIFKAICAPWI